MMISTKGRYALRMMIDLAQGPEEFVSLRDVAERLQVSVKYLEQIVAVLTKAGLLQSARGAGGGYRLARPAAQITAGEVLRSAEGSLAPIACTEGGESCQSCPSRSFWMGLQAAINDYADQHTLAELAQSETGPAVCG